MIVVTGHEPTVVSAVVAAIAERGERALAWTFTPDDPACDLVAEMRALDARVVVAIEQLGWHDADRPTAPDPALLGEVLRAGRSACGARVVFVTARPAGDAGLTELRRSGVGYAILRPAPLVAPDFEAAMRGSVVWIASTVPPPPFGVCTCAMLADAVADAACEGAHVGSTVDVGTFGERAWSELVVAAGGEPRMGSPWRVALARVLGERALAPPRVGVRRAVG